MGAVATAISALSPSFYYRLNETSGTSYADSGSLNLAATEVAAPSKGTTSLAPGDTGDTSVTVSAANPLASRAHNAADLAASSVGSFMALVRPDTLKTTTDNLIISKPNSYQLLFIGSKIRFDWGNNASGQFSSTSDLVTPGQTMLVVGVATGTTMTIYLNGMVVAQQSYTTPGAYAGTTALQLLGQNVIGNQGFIGAAHHLAGWYSTALSQAQIQSVYQTMMSSQAEVIGQGMNVFSWSRQVLAANGSRTRVKLTNDSDQRMAIARGTTAALGAGDVLEPGFYLETTAYKGAFSAIHYGPYGGAKRLAIVEE